jgi:hypothetical protein
MLTIHNPISDNHAKGRIKSSAPSGVCVRYRAQYLRLTKTVHSVIITEAVAMIVGPKSSAKYSGVMGDVGIVNDILN